MKIRVTKETRSGLKPGVYDAHKYQYGSYRMKQCVFVDGQYILPSEYQAMLKPATGLGERIMTTTSQLTCASMLHQGFNVRVRNTKTGRFVKWNDTVINTNGSRPMTLDYVNDDTTFRYALPREMYKWNSAPVKRQILNVNGLVTFDETYDFTNYNIVHQRDNEYVFEIFA